MIVLKKFFVLFALFLCGCSNKVQLNCSYVDNSSILGSKKVNDIITFKDDEIISYERNIDFSLQSGINSKNAYKVVKLEGKVLKRYIGGKYKIKRRSNSISMSFSSKRINNLKYIGIDSNYSYEQAKSVYSELGFSCK